MTAASRDPGARDPLGVPDPPHRARGRVSGPGVEEALARLFGGPPDTTWRAAAASADIPTGTVGALWKALGFPVFGGEERLLTGADVDALRHVSDLLHRGVLDDSITVAMTRAVARTADRLASWQTSLITDAAVAQAEREQGDPDQARRDAALRMLDLADEIEPLVVYAWRRHLAATAGHLLDTAAGDTRGADSSVGFADLVGFTERVGQMCDQELGTLVRRFEAIAADVVNAHGGRVVKTLGDEVVFVADRAAPVAAIALDLVDAIGAEECLPPVRAGVATGRVLPQLGDVYGTTVNRASRLTDIASARTVLIDDATAAALTSVSGFEMTEQPPRSLHGLGPTTSWVLRRAGLPTRRGPVSGR